MTLEEIKQERRKLNKQLLAARGARNWKEFVNQGFKYTPVTKEGRQTRVDRLIMVSNAIDAFDEIPQLPMSEKDDPKVAV